jgi:hypothetical protein
LHNTSHRWAYIAISGNRPLDDTSGAYRAEIQDFISQAYPQMMIRDEG